jgi:Mce-associated membrane protein
MSGIDIPAATQPAARASGVGRATPLAIAAVAFAVVAVTVLGVVLRSYSSRTDAANARGAAYLAGSSAQAAEAAAVREVTATLTYNYKTLQTDFANAEQGMTPTFRAKFAESTRTSVTPLATKQSAITTASVSASGVSQASTGAATVLVFANQTVQNALLTHPRLDRTRIKVSMVNLGGKWLIDNLSPL